ncbi:hypothetical protein NQ315_010959 [Exocentrus adspersus]|uniref:Uncharacterized protein n=1 Tax=Exocentrus adspersus TaxID=1586481 RepID=A0AAV8VGA2_9CUCU|nr:hypothetical protein NQ315_010959 [Exocentrus adspersus]
MVLYTRDEKVDMLLIYGECRKNAVAARNLYADREHNNDSEEKFIIAEETEINVLALVEADKTVSLRQIASELNISHKSVSRNLHKHKYKSFKYHRHQHLYEDDAGRRMEYCNWILRNNVLPNNNFLRKILFSDESRFTNFGMFNQ